MRRIARSIPLVVALGLAGCATRADTVRVPLPVTQTAVAHVDGPSGAHDNLNAVLWMQASAEYDAATLSLYHAAAARLDEALADPGWDALPRAARDDPGALSSLPAAVILDVDETVLDNAPYQARLVRRGTEYGTDTWAAWVEERAAGAVPGVADFLRAAASRGIAIVYVTNRTQDMRAATLDNLRALGLPADDGVRFLGKGASGCETTGSDKTCRRRQVAEDYRVLMLVGDQLGDFVEPADDSPAARQAVVERHAGWFGERWWMLPNPSYGDWEPALFGHDWALPAAARRDAKRAALDTGAR